MKKSNPIAVIDGKLPLSMQNAFSRYGFSLLPLPPNPALPAPVAGHPDLQLFVKDKTIFCLSCLAGYLQKNLPGYTILPVLEPPSPVYPYDVALNALPLGDLLFCRPSSLAPNLADCFPKKIAVRQGYARCAVCKVGENAAVTADRGLSTAMEANGISVLQIRPGFVSLPGYNKGETLGGMLGGATGYCPVGTPRIFFLGDLSLHPDGEAIASFCFAKGFTPISLLPGTVLYDAGTVFFL